MRISDLSSDVCSSDLHFLFLFFEPGHALWVAARALNGVRACRFNERIVQIVTISLPVLFLPHGTEGAWGFIALFQAQNDAAISKIQHSAACSSAAMRLSPARVGLVAALVGWPPAAMMSRPRGVRLREAAAV